MRILVVEGNTPEIVAGRLAEGGLPAAEQYAGVLMETATTRGLRVGTAICRPSFPDFDLEALDLDGIAGVVFTGSGVAWSADAPEARAHRLTMGRVLAEGLPVLGSCYGLHLAAVVLGGTVRANPRGLELGLARHVRLTADGARHDLHAGRSPSFDVACIHRDEVDRMPPGCVVTASNEHTEVQAMVCETGGVAVWAMQYHPELGVDETLGYPAAAGAFPDRERFGEGPAYRAMLAEIRAAMADPAAHAGTCWRYALGADVTDRTRHRAEIANWLMMVAARAGVGPAAALPAG